MRTFKEMKQGIGEKAVEINDILGNQAKMDFVRKVAEDEGVSIESALDMCANVPKYSLGMKMASPADLMMAASKKYVDAFKRGLTPEELEIFEKEVEPMGLAKLVKEEKRRQRKAAKK